jgi:predicted alpha/beta-fold hydrolase
VGVLIFRGCGGLPLRGCEAFAGHLKSDDIHAALMAVKSKFPQDKIFLMGFSLGGAFSLKYLAKCNSVNISPSSPGSGEAAASITTTTDPASSGNSVVTAAMCISPPWDFRKRTAVFDLAWNALLSIPLKQYIFFHFFSFFFFPSLYSPSSSLDVPISPSVSEKFKRRASSLRKIGPWRILTAGSLTAIDGLLYNFYEESYDTVQSYYNAMSPVLDAHLIRTPTIVVSAEDDPICCHTGAPTQSELGPGLAVVRLLHTYKYTYIYTNVCTYTYIDT